MKKKKDFMILAIEEAKRGVDKREGGPFGAVIVRKGKVVAIGHNKVLKTNDPTLHAEISALRKTCKKFKKFKLHGFEVYSTTEPCPMCYTALHWAGIKKIYFGTRTKDVAKLGFDELKISDKVLSHLGHDKTKIVPGHKRKECKELLEYWKKKNLRTY